MKAKVLFIPHPMPAHLIPLIVLAKSLDAEHFDIRFLVAKGFHSQLDHIGLKYMELASNKRNRLLSELDAVAGFDPDVLVDDLSFYTGYSSRLMKKPRISIVRKGIVPYEHVTEGYKHSSEVVEYFKSLKQIDFSEYELWRPASIQDLFVGDMNIIPSVPSVEVLPAQLSGANSYVYSGPLIMSDIETIGPITYSEAVVAEVREFISEKKELGKKIVYFTIGIEQAESVVRKGVACIDSLLNDESVSIITNFRGYEPKNEVAARRYFFGKFLPMNLICSHADMIIHKCGCGTYSYQLMYSIPGVALGSGCYDRDDIAKRLDELGALKYIPVEYDGNDFDEVFRYWTTEILNPNSRRYREQKDALSKLYDEVERIGADFDFAKVIRETVRKAGNIGE